MQERKLKVALCTDGIYPLATGGMQKHSRELVEALAAGGDLEIVVIHPHETKVFAGLPVEEIGIRPIDEKRNYLAECYRYSKRVYDVLERTNPDVVYSQGLSVWYNIRHIDCPVVINPHGLEPYQATGIRDKLMAIPFRIVFRYLFNRATRVMSLGGRLTEILRQHIKDRSKIVVIPNAVAVKRNTNEKPAPAEQIRVLFLARFAHNKGIDVLFDAIDILRSQKQLDKFHFIIAGTGPLYRQYKQREGVHISLPGYITDEDIPTLYNASDVFVLPTRFEGMPTVVLEAQSFGLPVIVSDVGATSELVDNSNGKLIPAGSPEALASALQWFQSLPHSERSKLGKSARLRVEERFSWKVVANAHRELFTAVAGAEHIKIPAV